MAIYNNEVDPNILMWEKLENERNKTMGTLEFQNWMKELNVSQSYSDKESIIKASEMNNQYDFTKLKQNTKWGISSLGI